MEALLRWAHPRWGLLWPGELLRAARGAGLLPELGRWVLGRCVDELSAWPTGSRLALNVAAAELRGQDYPLHLASVLAAAALPDGALVADLSETTLLTAGAAAVPLCAALRAAGAAVAVDDVSGDLDAPSRLRRLEQLDVDVVRLGHPLVHGLDADPARRAVVAEIARGHAGAGRVVVAEAVESWSEVRCLVDLGVERGCGYLFSPPQRADRARWLLQREARQAGWRGSHIGDEPTDLAHGVRDALPDRTAAEALRTGLSPPAAYGAAAGPVPTVSP